MALYDVRPEKDGYVVFRDGKVLQTPAGHPYLLPTRGLADAVAAEWNAQDPRKIDPRTMPFTQYAATALDIVVADKTSMVKLLASFAENDLLCHLASEPHALAERQREKWLPYLDWCAARFGARLVPVIGVMPCRQPENIAAIFEDALNRFDAFTLAALRGAAEATGSLVLALALVERAYTVDDLFAAADLDFAYQAEEWGEDSESAARRNVVREELKFLERWVVLLGL